MQALTLDWLQIAALLGAIQGFALSVVLATRPRNRTANGVLAVAIFTFSLQLISLVYHAVEAHNVFPHFMGVAYPLPLLYGPLILLYALTAGDHDRGLRRTDALHFLPFAAALVASIPVYAMTGAEKIAFYEQLAAGHRIPVMYVIDPAKYTSGIIYTIATIIAVRRHRTRLKSNYSSIERVNLDWLLRLAASGAVIWALASFLHFTEGLGFALAEREDDIVGLAIAVLVYSIGYKAIRQPEVFGLLPGSESTGRVITTPLRDPQRYERSGLDAAEATSLQEALTESMTTDHAYRDSELTLNNLADALSTTPHKLSEVLNTRLHQSFYDFVNGYRIREVQDRLAHADGERFTVLSLALDAGFASKSTFNHVFKKQTGRTPSEYRQSLQTG